jgi:ubiquinone/menaquinone biosynthesis C-methylase UbiE
MVDQHGCFHGYVGGRIVMSESMQQNLDVQSKSTWNQSYELHRAPNLWGEAAVPYVETVIKKLRDVGAQKVLDLPCGDGRNTLPLTRAFPCIVGADTSQNALSITQQVLAFHQVRNCVLMEADVYSLKFHDSQFDGVLCWDLLGHLQKASVAIEEMLRVCRPGGLVIGSLFDIGDSTRGVEMRAIGDEEYLYQERFYFKFYNRDQALALLQNFQAKVLSLDLTTWPEPPHEGYREYSHEHQSWVFTLQKTE